MGQDAVRDLLALVPELRAAGVAELRCGDVSITLGPQPPPPPTPIPEDKRDDQEREADAAAEVERKTRAAWMAYWQRMLRSSGAGVPDFPGVERARLVVGSVLQGAA